MGIDIKYIGLMPALSLPGLLEAWRRQQQPAQKSRSTVLRMKMNRAWEGLTGPAATQQVLRVVKVDGDGDCLFHALAFVDGHDGGALRIEMAEFLEEHAHEQAGFHEEWLQEAAKLRCNRWGGHTVIIAYSVMKNTKVMVHTKEGQGGAVKMEEMSHAAVQGKDDARVVHILYNGTHYDALVEITGGLAGMVPAWPQPPPPLYFKAPEQHEEFPSLAAGAKGQAKPKKQRLTAPRPAKKAKAKAPAKGKAKEAKPASVKPKVEGSKKDTEGEVAAPALAAATCAPLPPEEAEEEDCALPGLMEALEAVPVAEASDHPHRKVEDMIQERALQQFVPYPDR